MNIELIVVGKTDSKEVNALVENYTKRLSHYVRFGITYLPPTQYEEPLGGATEE